jgi:hypothetical protein
MFHHLKADGSGSHLERCSFGTCLPADGFSANLETVTSECRRFVGRSQRLSICAHRRINIALSFYFASGLVDSDQCVLLWGKIAWLCRRRGGGGAKGIRTEVRQFEFQ